MEDLPGPTEEKRAAHRRRMLKPGRIVFNRNTVFDCMVRDHSQAGARLLVPSIMGIPDQFTLLIGKASYSCRVVWRSWTALGVSFDAMNP